MRNLIKLTIGLLFTGITFISCQKDNEQKIESKSYFKTDNTEYILSDGSLKNYGTYNPDYNLWGDYNNPFYNGSSQQIVLCSEELSNLENKDTTSTHIKIFFRLFSTTGEKLDIRDYYCDNNYIDNEHGKIWSEGLEVGSFIDGWYYTYRNSKDISGYYESSYTYYDISDGMISVSKSDNSYEITINCINENGEKVTGSYVEELNYFDLRSDNN